jgi:hypothetical protein
MSSSPEKGALDDGEWHMLTITTLSDGSKGFLTYVDGEVAASMPQADDPEDSPNGGRAIDPAMAMRLCGRQKPGHWEGELGAPYDQERYFMGELAHFSVYKEAITEDQVKSLLGEYGRRFFEWPDPEELGSCFTHPGYRCDVTASQCEGVWYERGHISYRSSMDCCHCRNGCPPAGLGEGCIHADDPDYIWPGSIYPRMEREEEEKEEEMEDEKEDDEEEQEESGDEQLPGFDSCAPAVWGAAVLLLHTMY